MSDDMRITSILIHNFKSLYDVSFEPGNVNVLIGANGSGKSSVLEAIGTYKKAKDKIKCECTVHNTIFESTPTHLLQGKCGCKLCESERISSQLIKSHDTFVQQLSQVSTNIEVIGEYNGANNPIRVKCKKCDFEWEPTGSSLLCGFGCPKCSGRYKTTKDLINEVAEVNNTISIIGEYKGSLEQVECICNICGERFTKQASRLKYSGCPYCNMSHGELKIKHWLDDRSIEYISQKTFDNLIGIGGGQLSYDFYIPLYNMLIEYQGNFHDGSVKMQTQEQYLKQIEHDRRKREYALSNNIFLLEIWYYNYDNIENILNSIIYKS